jgi:hypothetical protein
MHKFYIIKNQNEISVQKNSCKKIIGKILKILTVLTLTRGSKKYNLLKTLNFIFYGLGVPARS